PLARWYSEQRRISLAISMPLYASPGLSLRIYADARNANWNLTQSFLGAGTPLTDVNMRRGAAGAEVHSIVNGRWSWIAGAEVAHRNFRNLAAISSPVQPEFFDNATSLAAWLGAERSLYRATERRFTLDSSPNVKDGREFANGLGPFATVRGSLRAHWLP